MVATRELAKWSFCCALQMQNLNIIEFPDSRKRFKFAYELTLQQQSQTNKVIRKSQVENSGMSITL